ncbi:trypsin-like peptidase domain-containing protein [Polaribacter sp. R2A056_3_33]|uniref:S1 family peptidase n=1 Tax=Polaribacter sp. R2A056_3_33 TaxID=2745563 RepID=UPI001C4F48D4|nr:serine protease [Polaribacter sp. R2A056_3_33]QXP70813.1 trypsin-like peptidase domain-containing protein [Polaribacter sp. R2A056_3_33]
MRISYLTGALMALALVSCGSINNIHDDFHLNSNTVKVTKPENSSVFLNNAMEKAKELLSENAYTPFEVLQKQKENKTEVKFKVSMYKSGDSKIKTGNEIYNYLKERTLYIGDSFLCTRCPNMHLSNASGFVINEDGIIVTNYHVIDVKGNLKSSAIFAIDDKGNVYSVAEVLSASKLNDIAVLQLDMQGKKLKPLELAEKELIGEDVFMMGHPFEKTFFMSKGIVAREYLNGRTNMPKISITADFGTGASGGPVVNSYGQLIGVVSATSSHYTMGSKTNRDIQMVIKEVVPVSVLNNYIN